MRLAIRHTLTFTPPPGTANAVLQLLLTPPAGTTQTVVSWRVEAPGIGNAGRFTDAYGNRVHLVNQSRPEGTLVVIASGIVETSDRHGVLGRSGGEPVPALYKRTTPLTKAPASLYGRFRGSKETRLDMLHALMVRVGEVMLAPNTSSQSQMQAGGSQLQARDDEMAAASATDLTHAFVGAARALGVPARFVTGYLLGEAGDRPARHAWAEAFDEGLGWIGFDPLLQLCPTDRHVRLAVALDAVGAQPLRAVPSAGGAPADEVSVDLA